jgi:multimeric flavodoxin WrbA
MQITLLNGNPVASDPPLETYLADLVQAFAGLGHSVQRIDLRDLDIRYCVGCFGCWVKTPGECVTADDSHQVCRAAIQADWLLFASPVSMGFISAELKRMLDKLIPLVHPYMVIDRGEIHHRKRYSHYPLLGLLVARSADTDEEDLEIIETSFKRLAINFKSRLGFFLTTDNPVQEVLHAVDSI